MQSMKIRKPVELSERCGVITAEKIAASAGAAALWLASSSMLVIISTPSDVFHGAQKPNMAKKPAKKQIKKPAGKTKLSKKAQGRLQAARKGKAAQVKPLRAR